MNELADAVVAALAFAVGCAVAVGLAILRVVVPLLATLFIVLAAAQMGLIRRLASHAFGSTDAPADPSPTVLIVTTAALYLLSATFLCLAYLTIRNLEFILLFGLVGVALGVCTSIAGVAGQPPEDPNPLAALRFWD